MRISVLLPNQVARSHRRFVLVKCPTLSKECSEEPGWCLPQSAWRHVMPTYTVYGWRWFLSAALLTTIPSSSPLLVKNSMHVQYQYKCLEVCKVWDLLSMQTRLLRCPQRSLSKTKSRKESKGGNTGSSRCTASWWGSCKLFRFRPKNQAGTFPNVSP